MLLHNSSEWSKNKPRWFGLVASLILTSCATLVRLAIHDYVQPNIPFQIFYISIIISTFYFGWISGFLATILSIIYGFYFFIRPYDSFGFPSVSDFYLIVVNFLTMMACVLMVEYLQRLIYTSSILLKASKNNYKLYIRAENSLLNLKTEINEYKKIFDFLTSKEETPLAWSDPYEVISYFEKINTLVPKDILDGANNKLLDLFTDEQRPMILNYMHSCLNTNSVVEFNFFWPTESENKTSFMGRLTPISINDKKSLIFSLVKNQPVFNTSFAGA